MWYGAARNIDLTLHFVIAIDCIDRRMLSCATDQFVAAAGVSTAFYRRYDESTQHMHLSRGTPWYTFFVLVYSRGATVSWWRSVVELAVRRIRTHPGR